MVFSLDEERETIALEKLGRGSERTHPGRRRRHAKKERETS